MHRGQFIYKYKCFCCRLNYSLMSCRKCLVANKTLLIVAVVFVCLYPTWQSLTRYVSTAIRSMVSESYIECK